MEETRSRAKQALSEVLDVPKLGHSVEVSAYNACIRAAEAQRIPRYWGNHTFRRMYSAKIRSLISNLGNRANPQLLQQATNGRIPPKALANLTPQQMFPDLWEDALHRRMVRDVEADPEEIPDSVISCKKCGSKKVVWMQRQVRSSDEPMTCFCQCTACRSRFRING